MKRVAAHGGDLAAGDEDSSPRVLGAYVIAASGLTAVRVDSAGLCEDPRLLGTMLGSVAEFLREALAPGAGGGPQEILRVAIGRRGFLMVPARGFGLLVVFEGHETEDLEEAARGLASRVERSAGETLRAWDGNRAAVEGARRLVREFFAARGTPALRLEALPAPRPSVRVTAPLRPSPSA